MLKGGGTRPNHEILWNSSDHEQIDFILALINYKGTTNEQIQFIVGNIAEYYSILLLTDDKLTIPHYFAHLCRVYKGVEFNPARTGLPTWVC